MNPNGLSVRDMTLIALFTALLAVSGLFEIPIGPAPITLQTLVVMLAGSLLGAKRGVVSIAVFIGLAAAGAPILAGGSGGLAKVIGPTGGFIFSWLLAVLVIHWLVKILSRQGRLSLWKLVLAHIVGGILVIDLIGIIWLVTYLHLPFNLATVSGYLLAFLPGDLAKAIVASLVAQTMYRVLPELRP